MKKSIKKRMCLALLAGVVTCAVAPPQPAFAFFKHHHRHHVVKHKRHKKKTSTLVRDAQTSLINLNYYTGNQDGLLGPKTKKAIMDFQRDHGMRVTGLLSHETYNAIIHADRARATAVLPLPAILNLPPNTLPAQPGLTGPTNEQYANPMLGGEVVAGGGSQVARTQGLSSRYAKLDVAENTNGSERRYTITLNGTPLLETDNQPSVIGISETYELGNEDAIILTTYKNGDPICSYKHYLLTLAEGRNELTPIGNCTHGYQARKVEDSLFITFPETDDQRVAGATWRYEDGRLERL